MNNYNKNIYNNKETIHKYKSATSYADIVKRRQKNKEIQRKEIEQILQYINSLNADEYLQLEKIQKLLLKYITYNISTTDQTIDFLKAAIVIQKQYNATTQATQRQTQSNPQTKQNTPKPAQAKPRTEIQIINSIKSKLKIQNQPKQQTTPQVMPKPTTTILDTKNRWSPISSAGKIYDFNRGVIGIDANGQKYKIILDRTSRHHNDATAEIGFRTNCTIKNMNAGPFEMAIEVAKQGVTIIQLEGNSMLVYLSDEITSQQLESLKTETKPRKNFDLSFTHKNYIYDTVNQEDLYRMCQNILTRERVLTKTR